MSRSASLTGCTKYWNRIGRRRSIEVGGEIIGGQEGKRRLWEGRSEDRMKEKEGGEKVKGKEGVGDKERKEERQGGEGKE